MFLQVCLTYPYRASNSHYSIDVVVFHAGTKKSGEDVVTAGGRVLAVTSYGPTLTEALKSVYAGVDNVYFDGKTFRRDIAHRCAPLFATVKTPLNNNRALTSTKSEGLTYAQAGVSVDAGNALVQCHQAPCARDV